jgi:hypothetical protein
MLLAKSRPFIVTSSVSKAPWLSARLAQGAIATAAAADVFRGVVLRAHRLHPTEASLSRSGFASMVFVYLMTAAVVLFLVWFSRCRRNAQVLTPGPPAGSGVWAVVAWLVPVVNLWVPRRLVLDVQRASSTGATEAERDEVLINAWWVTWVGHAVITVGSQGGRGTSILLLVVSQAFNLAAAVLAICVVQRITALQGAALHANPPFEPLTHA